MLHVNMEITLPVKKDGEIYPLKDTLWVLLVPEKLWWSTS